MKKFISLTLAVLMLASMATLAVSATDGAMVVTAGAAMDLPDFVITEIAPDTAGSGEVGGYSDGKDPFEFFEIYNASGKTLNLYDYCVTYNGNNRTNERFEAQIVEITPFKAGDYLDGSTLPWSGQTNECGDLSNKPVNPDTCMVAPGETVVVWSLFHESYYAMFNEGKGLSVKDFRTFWNIPDDVKVIAWDGGSNTGYGGNDKNFNLKNSGCGTYGIALYSEALNTAANTSAGSDAVYVVKYTEYPELACWASLDFSQFGATSIANVAYNFAPDIFGLDASDWGYTPDARRETLIEAMADPTPGKLTTLQKLILGVALEVGDALDISYMYTPEPQGQGKFQGLVINGKLYTDKETFTAEKAGVHSISYQYADPNATTVDTTTPAPVTGKDTEKETTTPKPGNETTPAPSGDTSTATPEKPQDSTTATPEKKGCGSVVALGLIACILPAAVVVCRKKH